MGLVFIVIPIALLFAMLTLLIATEGALHRLMEPGIAARAFRIGSVQGLNSTGNYWTDAEVNRIEAQNPGAHAAPANFEFGYVRDTDTQDVSINISNSRYIQIWDFDLHVEPSDLERWDATRDGIIITRAVADQYGWKIGDQVTLYVRGTGPPGGPPVGVQLTVVAISDKFLTAMQLYVHIEFWKRTFEAPLKYWVLWVLVDSPDQRQAIMDKVSAELTTLRRPFQIWPAEMSKSAILSGSLLLRNAFRIAGGFSVLLILTISTALLVLSIEQRSTQLAAMRALGFRRAQLTRMILVEGVLLLFPGAALGAVAAWVPFHSTPIAFDAIFSVKMDGSIIIASILGGALLGLIAAAIPAWRTYRLDVLTALR